MWANAQRDGRPAEYRWRPLFNAVKFGLLRFVTSYDRLLPQVGDMLVLQYLCIYPIGNRIGNFRRLSITTADMTKLVSASTV